MNSSTLLSPTPVSQTMIDELLNRFPQVMVLRVFVDPNVEGLREKYQSSVEKHNYNVLNGGYVDAGFDVFCAGNNTSERENLIYGDSVPLVPYRPNKMDFAIACSATMHGYGRKSWSTGYYMYPRSSTGKTQMRLANSVGIIDSGYRGNLIGLFDVVNTENDSEKVWARKFERYVQICSPCLCPILVQLVETKEELSGPTQRGSGGFGSTGV